MTTQELEELYIAVKERRRDDAESILMTKLKNMEFESLSKLSKQALFERYLLSDKTLKPDSINYCHYGEENDKFAFCNRYSIFLLTSPLLIKPSMIERGSSFIRHKVSITENEDFIKNALKQVRKPECFVEAKCEGNNIYDYDDVLITGEGLPSIYLYYESLYNYLRLFIGGKLEISSDGHILRSLKDGNEGYVLGRKPIKKVKERMYE